jgi:hypothetical protein
MEIRPFDDSYGNLSYNVTLIQPDGTYMNAESLNRSKYTQRKNIQISHGLCSRPYLFPESSRHICSCPFRNYISIIHISANSQDPVLDLFIVLLAILLHVRH